MPSFLHVQTGFQFRADLRNDSNPDHDLTAWLDALGTTLEAKGTQVTIGNIVISTKQQLLDAHAEFKADPQAFATKIGFTDANSTSIEEYFPELIEVLDDVAKDTSRVQTIDLTHTSAMAKALGLDSWNSYADNRTKVGKGNQFKLHDIMGIQVSKKPIVDGDPLAGIPYINGATFAATDGFSWNRDSVELEIVRGISGIEGQELIRLLRTTNNNGRSLFQRLRRPEDFGAFSIGYRAESGATLGIDDIPWTAGAHALREAQKFVSLVIEGGRYEADANGQRELSLGTDKMDDTFNDTANYDLTKQDFLARARARWDTDTVFRRALIAVKAGTFINEFGIKQNDKADVRIDFSPDANQDATEVTETLNDLNFNLRAGTGFDGEALKILKPIYDKMNELGALETRGDKTGLLLLEPKLNLRSTRARFHLNETDLEALQAHYKACTQGVSEKILPFLRKAAATATPEAQTRITALLAKFEATANGSAVTERVQAKYDAWLDMAELNKILTPSETSDRWDRAPLNAETIERLKRGAVSLDELYHELAAEFGAALNDVFKPQTEAVINASEQMMAWLRAQDTSLGSKTTIDPYIQKLNDAIAQPAMDEQTFVDQFNAFGEAQRQANTRPFRDFTPIALNDLASVRTELQRKASEVWQRQLESGGSTAQALWFEEARRYYIGGERKTGNFIIDTTDMVEFLRHEDWKAIPADQRTPSTPFPVEKMFHGMLANENQIELGEEKEFTTALRTARSAVAANNAMNFATFLSGTDRLTQPGFPIFTAWKQLPETEKQAKVDAFNQAAVARDTNIKPVTLASLEALTEKDFTDAEQYLLGTALYKYLQLLAQPGQTQNVQFYQLETILSGNDTARTDLVTYLTERGITKTLGATAAESFPGFDPAQHFVPWFEEFAPTRTLALNDREQGAKWVFEQYIDAQNRIVEAKGQRIVRMLKEAGAPDTIAWTRPPQAKGEEGMHRLAKEKGIEV